MNALVDTAALRLRAAATSNLRVANLDMPEQNGGVVTIHSLKGLVVNDHLHDAYLFAVSGDVRYLMEHQEWYKAYVHGHNKVIIQFPSVPYTDFNDPEALARGRRVANIEEPRAVQAEVMLRHALQANQDRQLTTVCFQLPHNLDNGIFSPGQPDNRIHSGIIPEVQPGSTTATSAKIQFVIAIQY